ncbi:MAG: hypothetical protein FWD25_11105 [Clostridia bacterium]|nr:hypothetical protein [Clostridia bacterium]
MAIPERTYHLDYIVQYLIDEIELFPDQARRFVNAATKLATPCPYCGEYEVFRASHKQICGNQGMRFLIALCTYGISELLSSNTKYNLCLSCSDFFLR